MHTPSIKQRSLKLLLLSIATSLVFVAGCSNESDSAKTEAPTKTTQAEQAINKAKSAAEAVENSVGKMIYTSACFSCHAQGIAGAPKMGDIEAWAPRIAKGTAVLHEHSIKGFQGDTGIMLPKGGRADLSDEEVKAAVDYMIANSE